MNPAIAAGFRRLARILVLGGRVFKTLSSSFNPIIFYACPSCPAIYTPASSYADSPPPLTTYIVCATHYFTVYLLFKIKYRQHGLYRITKELNTSKRVFYLLDDRTNRNYASSVVFMYLHETK